MRKLLFFGFSAAIADAFDSSPPRPLLWTTFSKRFTHAGKSAAQTKPAALLNRRARVAAAVAHTDIGFIKTSGKSSNSKPSAVYVLILANFIAFLGDYVLRLPMIKALYLSHSSVAWWQPVTSIFCHGSFSHLSGNNFLLLLFGRSVEDENGWGGLLFSFIFCGILANLVSLALLPPNTVSIGASGAVFGLFTVSIFSRLSLSGLDWRKAVEIIILGEFVFNKMLLEMRTAASGGIAGVNHVVHLAGAGSGILLMLLMRVFVGKMEVKDEKVPQLQRRGT